MLIKSCIEAKAVNMDEFCMTIMLVPRTVERPLKTGGAEIIAVTK